jgi:tetratricopeptide (TPR) repeat protein
MVDHLVRESMSNLSFYRPRLSRCVSVILMATMMSSSYSVAQVSPSVDRPPVMSDEGGAIPVSVVDGRLIVACDISGPKLRVPVNLWLDFDGAFGLQLHNRAAAPLPAETPAGKPLPLTLHFPDFTLEIARRELGPEEEFETFTKYHSKELGENALTGAIGGDILKHFDVIFDLPRGQVLLAPPGQLEQQQGDPLLGDVVVPISLQNDLVWLPVALQGANPQAAGEPLKRAMAIGSSRYDSVLDRRLCNSLRRPAGNVGPVLCESIDFSPYVAFRPDEVVQVHPDGVAGVMGINLLERFRIHVDRQSLLATLRSTASPVFPQQDLAWFQAMVAEDRDLVLNWLEQHGDSRLGREAAEFLLNLLLDEGAEPDEANVAIQWVNDTMPADLRATRLFDLMEELVNEGETDLGIAAGELGVKSARKDRYPESNYKLHGRLGELLLPSDKREAWRHLLSAAFGLPQDGMINLNLARVYEANGKKNRAFSRYIQALVKEESSELAMEALMRLDNELPPEQRMTIETIDRMISGRVRNYSAPDMYQFDAADRTNRTSLVEFFTNAYVGTEQRGGAIGGAMGNQGVMSHFSDTECICLSYHLSAPRLEPLVTPLGQFMAQWLGVNGPVVQVVDGVRSAPGAGKFRDAEKIYGMTRDAVISRLQRTSSIEITTAANLDGKSLTGEITIKGPAIGSAADLDLNPLVVQVVVAERGVVFHGSSGVVIHRMLARGLATAGPLSGVAYLPDDEGRLDFSFARDLTEIEKENATYLDSLEAGQTKGGTRMGLRIEPNSVEVIVLVRDATSGEVVQAQKCELQREEKGE